MSWPVALVIVAAISAATVLAPVLVFFIASKKILRSIRKEIL